MEPSVSQGKRPADACPPKPKETGVQKRTRGGQRLQTPVGHDRVSLLGERLTSELAQEGTARGRRGETKVTRIGGLMRRRKIPSRFRWTRQTVRERKCDKWIT